MFFFTQAGLNCTGFFRSESLTWLKHIIIYSGSKVFQPVMTDCEVVLLSGVVFYDFGRESGPDWGAQVETQLFKWDMRYEIWCMLVALLPTYVHICSLDGSKLLN